MEDLLSTGPTLSSLYTKILIMRGGLPNRHISLSETEVPSCEYYCCSICWSMFYTCPYWRHYTQKLQLFIFGGRNSNYLNCKKLNISPKAMLPLEIMLINVLHLSLLKTLYRKTTAIYKFFFSHLQTIQWIRVEPCDSHQYWQTTFPATNNGVPGSSATY